MEQADGKHSQKATMCIQTCTTTEETKKNVYGTIFTSEIMLAKLDRYLAKKKKNTAPGVSGIRIDHIAALYQMSTEK
jgi:hypothetical protein